MVASRCESHFSVLANVYRWLNMEIEQLANQQANIADFSELAAGTIEIDTCLSVASLSRFRDCSPRNERENSQWAVIS